MNAEASPRPWRVNGHSIEANDPEGLWLQNEKTGWGVVANLPSCPKSRMSKKNRETWDAIVEANAALIVDAVNEYNEVAMQNTDSNGARRCASLAQARREEWSRKELAKEARELRAERERLRDLVRRLSRHLANYITSESENDLLREARAAIGEDRP